MSPTQHLLYFGFVALASYVQNLTGFAFGLILLGLAGLWNVGSLPDVSNAVSVVALVNVAMLGRPPEARVELRMLAPTLVASLPGVVCGVLLLNWLSDNVVTVLRILLGATIFSCAVLLAIRARPLARRSGPWSFASIGLLSGVLGGLFATSGPPLAYHFYRQPLPLAAIRSSLVTIFAVGSGLRLAMMAATGRITMDALWMTLEALPVVIFIGWHARRRPLAASLDTARRIVSLLLAGAGLGILVPAAMQVLERVGSP